MNAWFRMSKFLFKILIAACIFLIGAHVGTEVTADWKLFSLIAVVATSLITVTWCIGKFSANKANEKIGIDEF